MQNMSISLILLKMKAKAIIFTVIFLMPSIKSFINTRLKKIVSVFKKSILNL